MQKRLRRMQLSKKMMITYAGTMAALILCMSMLLFFHFRKVMRQFTRESMISVSNANAQSMEMLLGSIEKAINLVVPDYVADETNDSASQGYYVVRLLQGYSDDPSGIKLVEQFQLYQQTQKMLSDYFGICLGSEKNNYYCALFADERYEFTRFLGTFRSWNKYSGGVGFFGQEEVAREVWYMRIAKNSGEPVWFTLPDSPGFLFMGKQLKYKYIDEKLRQNEENIGMLVCRFDLNWIKDQMTVPAFSDSGMIFLANQNGELLYASDPYPDEELKSVLGKTAVGTVETCMYKGSIHLIQINDLSLGVRIGMLLPDSSITDFVWNTIRIIFILAGIMIVLGTGFICLFSMGLVHPIRRLCTHMKSGMPEEIAETEDACEEIRQLYGGFNQLMRQIRQLVADVYASEEKKKQAELSALQAQINPHFLYNTLDSINCLALMEGQDEIADLLTSLSDILRYSLKNAYDLVRLETELTIVEHYARIQKNCYENKLQIYWDVKEAAKKAEVPKLLIQPLVENAIVHGMEEGDQVKIIEIEADICDHVLEIRVWDNGTRADLERIRQYLTGEKVSRPETGGLGIYNVAERLRMIYGKKGSLTYEKDENGCTVAVVRIPEGS